MSNIVHDIKEMQRLSDSVRVSGKRIGLVPTMGALHEGHLSLIRLARERADFVATSVFVNPTQFGQGEDFDRYPRDLDSDARKAFAAGSDLVFAPAKADMYEHGYSTFVHVGRLPERLEGASRPGHFRGVATVVTKLLNITKPHVAVFGQKDAQQVAVIRKMVRDLNMDVDIIVGPTVREQDGLAMSSRNAYLTPEQRREATVLYRALQYAQLQIAGGAREAARIIDEMQKMIRTESSGVVDYVSIADAETLEEVGGIPPGRPLLISLAVRFGTTRLIDNIHLKG
jgi:pantoate--beta-alanine ligase